MKKIALCLVFVILFSWLQPFTASAEIMSPEPQINDIGSSRNQLATNLSEGYSLVRGKIIILASKGHYITASVPYYFNDSNGVTQWTATLTGTFYYDGTVSYCTNSSCTTSVQHGNWSETANTPSYAGNAAFASVTMVRKVLFIVVQTENLNLTLTCDANGNLS